MYIYIMISTYFFLYERLINYAAKYQLAAPAVDEFNSALKEVQLEAVNILCPLYQTSEKIRTMLSPLVRRIIDVSDSNGQLLQPQRVGVEEETTELFYRVVAMAVTDNNGNMLYGISPAMEAEIVEMQRIPQRKPDLTKSRAYYIGYDEVIQLYPQQQIPYELWYVIYPPDAYIAFNYVLVNGEYVQQYDPGNSSDLSWDPSASNLLLYLMLEKYGISSRDDILQEYAGMGLKLSLNPNQSVSQ